LAAVRGRKKYAAVNYRPADPLVKARSMATMGVYHNEAVWGYVKTFFSDRKKDQKQLENFYQEHPELCPKAMIVEWCKILLETGDARGFAKLGEMMEAAERLGSEGREVVERDRAALLDANEKLYQALSDAGKHKAEVKKAELVNYVYQKFSGLFADKEQSDVLKMMRKMGLPRRPEWLVPEYLAKVRKRLAAARLKRGGK